MSKKTSTKSVKEFLTKTGFILEMQIAEMLRDMKYSVTVSTSFYDYESNKKREIDIIATKKINEILLCLIIECKQSLVDDWIFICSNQKPRRYYNYIKHLPDAGNVKETKVFDHFHQVDRSVPLTQNYIIKDKNEKKSSSIQIETCLEKLPKAVVEIAYSANENERWIFLPVAVFNGQMFIAEYTRRLDVKSVERLQYRSSLESENYKYHQPKFGHIYSSILDQDKNEEDKNSPVARVSNKLGPRYLIDFVTKKGFSKLISKFEREICCVNLEKWQLIIK
jgi:hypothetical protein